MAVKRGMPHAPPFFLLSVDQVLDLIGGRLKPGWPCDPAVSVEQTMRYSSMLLS
jgi:hypothetical protein